MQSVKKTDKITFHIISHTHWDREWYLPFEVFRIELIELIDNLLDILEQNSNFIFHLDGQTIVLQDYLEIKPHKTEQIKKFVKSGNLLIGPWYVLSDQFLTSGEATIRNLMYGFRDSSALGKTMLVGYCPDQFGQIAQLPQIFKGFNINSAIIGRGIQDNIAEHTWYAPNGDYVTAISLTHWYNNAQKFPGINDKTSLHDYLGAIYKKQCHTTHSGHILLMNGCDHLFPESKLSEILKSQEENQKWQIKQNSLPGALKSITEDNKNNKYQILYGELRDDNDKFILAGTLSSRIYLKLANYLCQTKLEKIIEPLSSMLYLHKKINYKYDHIKHAWKLLIQNHVHDSICGCSVDEVHKEMETRFLKINQILDKLIENLLSPLGALEENNKERKFLQIINLTNYERDDLIETEVVFPLSTTAAHPDTLPEINKKEIKKLTLKHKGEVIESKILENYQVTNLVRSKDEVPLLQLVQKIKILFKHNIKPYSANTLEITVEKDEEKKKEIKTKFETPNFMLNVNKNGSVSIFLKENNYGFNDIHFFSIEDDLGDSYNFVPGSKSIVSTDWEWNQETIEENEYRKRILLKAENTDKIKIETEIKCYSNSNRIDFNTKIKNSYKNKRIRLHFPTQLKTSYIDADTSFGVLKRARPIVEWKNCAFSQPLHNWLDQSNGNFGLAFFSNGIADYELYKDGNGFAVTLIRAIGKLSSVKSLSHLEIPDAQCEREIKFSYAIFPHEGDWKYAQVQKEQLIYQTPIITNQSNEFLDITALFTLPKEVIVSSFKRSEDKNNLYILRFFNPMNETLKDCTFNLNLSIPIRNLYWLTLNEDIKNTIDTKKGKAVFEIKPYEIITIGIEL